VNTSHCKPGADRYSAHNSLRPVNFFCDAPGAQLVQIAGDFNHWYPVPLHRQVDGWWSGQILLCHGHHQYRFLVDGQARLDPAATGIGRDSSGEPVSLIAVS
jgi:1,4-alpha-glucan branching enzyme